MDNNLVEGKKLGILYHYTEVTKLITIVTNNELLGKDRWFKDNSYYVISLTRNKNFTSQPRQLGKSLNSRIVLDGNKLSNKYKFSPYASRSFRRPEDQEQEERLYMKDQYLTNLDKYVISYDLYLEKILNHTFYRPSTLLSILNFLVKVINNKKFNFYFKEKQLTVDEVKDLLKVEIINIKNG